MTEIISSITASINILKTLRTANEKIKDAEFATLFANLELQLAEMKVKIADLMTQNSDLKAENTALKQKTDPAIDLDFREGYYYTKENDGPFCATCFEQDKKKVRLTANNVRVAGVLGRYSCPGCNKNYP